MFPPWGYEMIIGKGGKMPYSKYRAKPTIVDGIRFASKKESKRYGDLKLLAKNEEICNLECQVKFPLMVDKMVIGRYIADFTYDVIKLDRLVYTVEDVKGMKTPLYRWKKKHFEAQYAIKIKET